MHNYWLDEHNGKKKYLLEHGRIMSVKGNDTLNTIFTGGSFKRTQSPSCNAGEWISLCYHGDGRDYEVLEALDRICNCKNLICQDSKAEATLLGDLEIFAEITNTWVRIVSDELDSESDVSGHNNHSYKIIDARAQFTPLSHGLISVVLYGRIEKN